MLGAGGAGARRAGCSSDDGRARRGRLVVCPTPIGNLEDVTLRVLRVLREADVVACEDTRHTRKLLDRHGIDGARWSASTSTTSAARAASWRSGSRRGEIVALVSDAGTPGVSDPGFVLVRECMRAGLPVEVLPGPSAVVTALVASGLPGRAVAVRGLPAAQGRASCGRVLERGERDAGRVRVAAAAAGRTLALLAEIDPERAGRGLPRADQAARGGRARDRRASWRSGSRRARGARSCW